MVVTAVVAPAIVTGSAVPTAAVMLLVSVPLCPAVASITPGMSSVVIIETYENKAIKAVAQFLQVVARKC